MPVDFLITGFSAFHQVDCNPTEVLVQRLRSLHEKGAAGLEDEVHLIATDVLKVAVGAVANWQSTHFANITAVNPTVLVHFGLDVAGKEAFRLEEQAVNEATFRCPDQDGWCPCEVMIDNRDGSLHAELHSSLPLIDLQNHHALRNAWADYCAAIRLQETLIGQGFPAVVSHSAGLFLCNWIYYTSLRHCAAAANLHALFVHVPPFQEIGEEAQLRFVIAVINSICRLLHQPVHSESKMLATAVT